jgi:hypothetical protein
VLPIGLAVAGVGLWRLGPLTAEDAEPAEDRPSRRAERAREKELRAQRARERDAALEAAALPAAPPEDDEDLWAPQRRD